MFLRWLGLAFRMIKDRDYPKLWCLDHKIWIKIRIIELSIPLYIVVLHDFTSEIKRLSGTHDNIFSFWSKLKLAEDIDRHLCRHILF